MWENIFFNSTVSFNFQKKSSSSGDNLVMSPFSVSAVVSMALTGARGSTADQMRAGLSLPADEHLLAGKTSILAFNVG